MTNIEYIAACITLLNIIMFGIFMTLAIVTIVKELKWSIKLDQEKYKESRK